MHSVYNNKNIIIITLDLLFANIVCEYGKQYFGDEPKVRSCPQVSQGEEVWFPRAF